MAGELAVTSTQLLDRLGVFDIGGAPLDNAFGSLAMSGFRSHTSHGSAAPDWELIQSDGWQHAWFEDRGPTSSLLIYVDDSTARLGELHFARSESAFSYLEGHQLVSFELARAARGLPQSLPLRCGLIGAWSCHLSVPYA